MQVKEAGFDILANDEKMLDEEIAKELYKAKSDEVGLFKLFFILRRYAEVSAPFIIIWKNCTISV